MKKFKSLASLALCLVLSGGILSGCNPENTSSASTTTSSTASASESETTSASESESASAEASNTAETNAIDTSEKVKLKMYLLGDRAADFDAVYAEINKILEEKVNATVDVEFLSWGEHATKYSLLFSSQEEFDLIFTATSWGHYEQTVALGGFYPLTKEFIGTYAPDILKVVPEVAWDQAKIDGQMYMVPQYNNEFQGDTLAVRGDLMEKYGFTSISTYDEMKKFYMTIAEKEDGIYASQLGPLWQFFQSKGLTTTGGAPMNGTLFLNNTQDPSDLKFRYLLDWDDFTEYCKDAKLMADAGCWSPDILSSPQDRQTGFLNGTVASMIWNLGSCKTYAKQVNAEHPEWKATIVDPNASVPKLITPYINAGVGINNNSKNKERAMMVLNEFYTNPKVNDLAKLGIEGKNWEAVGEKEYKLLDQTGYVAGNNCDWGWRNLSIARTEFIENRTALDDTYDSIFASWTKNTKTPHPYEGFNLNTTNVTTQIAAVEAIMGTYYHPLVNGLVDDVDASLTEFRAAMENAGIRDIIAELEKQAADYVASKQ